MTGQDVDVGAPVLFPDYSSDVKRCTKCKEVRPITEFRYRSKRSDQRHNTCRLCHNAYKVEHEKTHKRKRKYYSRHGWWVKSKYNLTPAQYESMLSQQQGCCLICGGNSKGRRLSVDHDHKTGQVRGLLCIRCNAMIGWIESSPPEALANALKYLSEH